MNQKAKSAWEIYLKMEGTQESFAMLQLLANDCYRAGAFLYAAKAFDTLERLDPNPEYWDGKGRVAIAIRSLAATVGAMKRGSPPAQPASYAPFEVQRFTCCLAALVSSAACLSSRWTAACNLLSRCSFQWVQRTTTSKELEAVAVRTSGLNVHCSSSFRSIRFFCCCSFCSRSWLQLALLSATAKVPWLRLLPCRCRPSASPPRP